MLAYITQIKPLDGKDAEVELILLQLAARVRAAEPGNVLYELTRGAAGDLSVWEIYRDSRAAAAHLDNPYVLQARRELEGLLAGPPQVMPYEVLSTHIS